MTTWFLKECPTCGGDLYLDPLISVDKVKCLQCGLEVKLSFSFGEIVSEEVADLASKIGAAK